MNGGPSYAGRRVLISGGAGFIGSQLAARLVELGAVVSIIDRLDPGTGANLYNLHPIQGQVELTVGDIRDRACLAGLLPRQELLFNLAGISSHTDSMRDPQRDLAANASAHLSLLEACRELNPAVRILYTGTRQIYGRADSLPVAETHPLNPPDFNGVSKLAGELYHRVAGSALGLWTCVLRLTNVYGPHMRVRDSRQTFVGWWLRQLIEGRPLQVYGDGQHVRDLNHVQDVVDALLACGASDSARGRVYNLGATPIRLLDLAGLLVRINQGGSYELVPFPGERLRIDIGDYAGDFTRIREELGWEPRIDLQAGLEETLAFYREKREFYW